MFRIQSLALLSFDYTQQPRLDLLSSYSQHRSACHVSPQLVKINIGSIVETPSAIVEHGANLSHHCMSNNRAPSLQRLYPV